ncbi:SGNH/GDSL hydrolase family protein [soil metagenome]
MKILFQGDSITDAYRKPEEFNIGYQLGNGYAFLAAATLGSKYPDRGWQFINRGISGNTIAALAERWQEDALDHAPDLLSLLIGVNDTLWGQAEGPERFLETYEALLDAVQSHKSETGILLLEPFLLEAGDIAPATREHLRIRQRGIARIAVERSIPLVPLQEIFDRACERAPAAYWAFDGIHPTHAGAALISEAWLKAAEPLYVGR